LLPRNALRTLIDSDVPKKFVIDPHHGDHRRFSQGVFHERTTDDYVYLIQKIEAWQQFVFNFSAVDGGPAGPLDLQFLANGPAGTAVHLDDVQLGSVNDLAQGAWRSEMISTLTQLRPGYLRDWQGQLGDTMTNRLASAFARAPTHYNPDLADDQQWFFYSLPDFLSLCQQIGAKPWIVLPTTLSSSEFTALGQYLIQAQQTYNFGEIVVEFGDENWNSVFRAAGIQNPVVMAHAANRGFTLLRAAAGSSVPLHLVVNGQFVNPWVGQQAIINAPQADAVDVAPYYFYTLNAADSPTTVFANMFTMSDEPAYISDLDAVTVPMNKSVDIYEVNASTFNGNAPESQRDPYVAGTASGTALDDRLITGMSAGVRRQVVYDLAQYNYNISSSVGNMMLWGVANSVASSVSLRPTGLAVEMLNSAIGGDFYPVSAIGPAASGITAAAFLSNSSWSMAIVSTNSAPSQIAISLPSSGTPPTRVFTLSAPLLPPPMTSLPTILPDNSKSPSFKLHLPAARLQYLRTVLLSYCPEILCQMTQRCALCGILRGFSPMLST
jgi:hypothetical protein